MATLKYQSLVSINETVNYNIKFAQFECTQNKNGFMWKKELKNDLGNAMQ